MPLPNNSIQILSHSIGMYLCFTYYLQLINTLYNSVNIEINLLKKDSNVADSCLGTIEMNFVL